MVDLHRKYGHIVDFVAVYVREAHPGANLRQPRVAEDRLRNACRFRSHHAWLRVPVAVDDIDGTVHRSFGTRPSSAYLLNPEGVFSLRSGDAARLAELLERSARGDRRARVHAELPLSDAAEAHRVVAKGGVRGRFVLPP